MPAQVQDPPKVGERTQTTIIKETLAPAGQTSLPGMEPAEETFDGFEYLRGLTDRDWDGHMVYLYWLRPGARSTGPYIDVLTEAPTIEGIKQSFGGSGGGTFALWINKLKQWRKTYKFEIEGDRIFQGRPTQDSPSATVAAAGGNPDLVAVLMRLADRLGTADNPAAGQKALELMDTAYRKSVETIASAGGSRSGEGEGGLIAAIRLLRELGLIGGQSNNLLDTIKTFKELGLLSGGRSDALSEFDKIEKFMDRIEKFKGESGETDWKAALVHAFREFIPQIPSLSQAFTTPAPSSMPAAVQPSAARVPQPNPTESRVEQPENPQPQHDAADSNQIDMTGWLWERAAVMIEQDFDGDQIAEFLHISTLRKDPATGALSSIVANFRAFPAEGVLGELKKHPALAEAFGTLTEEIQLERVQHFLHYCKTGEMWPDDEDDEDDDEKLPLTQ